jgi:hypothetical protein
MFHALKDLLPDALRRGRIGQEMAATKIVETFNQWVIKFLPPGRQNDARAISYKNKILNINCQNTAVAYWLNNQTQEIVKEMGRLLPEIPLLKITTRITQGQNYDF